MPRKRKQHTHLSKVAEETWTNPETAARTLQKRKETKAVLALTSMTPETANSRTSEVPSHCFPATTVVTASNEHGCLNHAARCPVAQEKAAGIQAMQIESTATLVVNFSFLLAN